MIGHEDIRLGTLIKGDQEPLEYLRQILPLGFECVQIVFGSSLAGIDLQRLAGECREILEKSPGQPRVSAVGIYGNPLIDDETVGGFSALIAAAADFGCGLVCGFAGRLPGRPVPESLPRFQQVFKPLAGQAEDRGVRIAFENCDMGGTWEHGDWNIAHSPTAWELMFEAIPSPALGLEWEPCHQLVSLVDPLPQLRQWVGKVFHLHGKDATVQWDAVRRVGIRGGRTYVQHRTPGFGDTNWADVISILREGGFRGTIDIEGWHDPVYRNDLEMTGQVHALKYLKWCRGGEFVPNPRK